MQSPAVTLTSPLRLMTRVISCQLTEQRGYVCRVRREKVDSRGLKQDSDVMCLQYCAFVDLKWRTPQLKTKRLKGGFYKGLVATFPDVSSRRGRVNLHDAYVIKRRQT